MRLTLIDRNGWQKKINQGPPYTKFLHVPTFTSRGLSDRVFIRIGKTWKWKEAPNV